nr:phage tail spike protein [Staphylococcus haemolyticus]
MIHILDFNDNIIDFINKEDGALLTANLKRDVEEKTETFDFTILSDRADNMRERNRVITQDHNGIYREFIIVHVEDDYDGTTDVQCNASYLEDLTTSKPLPPQTFEKMTTSQALTKALADTGWEVSDETEYGGVRSKSWTSYNNPYEVVNMLETAYEMVSDYYIELGSHTVEHRYVSLKKPNSLFNGKEITKGKDLTGLTRTVDTSEVRTALIALGPEDDEGNRETVIVKDDEAHAQFGLPGRYLWDVYEPESEDSSMTKERLTTLATTELNKRKQLSVSYEISALDIHRYYDDVRVSLRDIVRVKDRDFNPPLYVEAEVISCEYDMILDDTVFKFGNVVEYEETALREEFNRRLDEIRKKLNDNISNVNTIVNDAIEGELEYYERKIIKSDTPPENPVEDMLWYDTSNPNVAVLKRYHNGEWRNETAKNVEQLGGMTREQVLYNSLTNTFQNLNIQHSKLLEEVYQLLNSEYLVDTDIRNAVNNAVNNTTNIYDQIKSNLDTMTGDTATIGKLVDTQALFLKYRERLQDLYKAMRNAQVAVEDRLALLQSQYTDEKFNEAMNEVAKTLPNGRWDSDKQQLFADIPNESDIENLRTSLQQYTDGQINDLNGVLGEQINSRINNTKNEISANISSLERKIDGIEVGGRNLLLGTLNYDYGFENDVSSRFYDENNKRWLRAFYSFAISQIVKVEKGKEYTISFTVKPVEEGEVSTAYTPVRSEFSDKPSEWLVYKTFSNIDKEQRLSFTITPNSDKITLFFLTALKDMPDLYYTDLKIEKGTTATDWMPAPEDVEKSIKQAQIDAEVSAKAYAEAQDELKQIEAKAYADGIVDEEEKRAIEDAKNKFDEAKKHAEEQAQQAQTLANEYAQKYTDEQMKNIDVGGRNLFQSYNSNFSTSINKDIVSTQSFTGRYWATYLYSADFLKTVLKAGETYTYSYEIEIIGLSEKEVPAVKSHGVIFYSATNTKDNILSYVELEREVGNKYKVSKTFVAPEITDHRFIAYSGFYSDDGTIQYPTSSNLVKISNLKLEKGNKATDWTPAPEDTTNKIATAQANAEAAAKAYADAQDNLKQTETKAYADGIVDEEEKRAIADAIAKRDEAKRYAEQKAQDAQNAANQNTQEVIKPITTRVTSTESDVKILKGQIGLMAKSDDVTQQLKNVDGRLTPLETTVRSNKATLDLLPDQINSKVSNQDYTTDQNNLITRLNNADSERKQLSNSISDKVSLTEYNNGINGVKSYTDNKVNNISVGSRNLLEGSANIKKDFNDEMLGIKQFFRVDLSDIHNKLKLGDVVTISFDVEMEQGNILRVYDTNVNYDFILDMETFNNIGKGKKRLHFTKTLVKANKNSGKWYLDFSNSGNAEDKYTISNIKIEKGNIVTDWTPAPEDVNSSISNASADTLAKANNYTDNKNNEVQKTLTKMNTDISQNGKDIQLRATKEEFNATNKTLSKTVADFTTNVATGMTFTYNENGTIQSMNIGNDGIKLRGDKVDITVNKEFNVVANKVDNKVGKDEVINRLNLSPEGLDIDVNKVGIRGGDSTNYIYLSQDKIEMAGTFQRTFRGNTQKDNVFMRAQGGYLRFRNNNQNRSLYYSDFGISTYIDGDSSEASGTLQFFDYTYSPTNSVRGVTLNSAGGAIALNSERNRIVLDANATVNIESETSSVYIRPMKNNRAGTNEFRFWTKLNDSVADTDGVLSYGTITELVEKAPASYSFGSGIRFDKSPKSRYIYATDKDGNIGTGDFYARNLLGDWWAKNNNLYALVDPEEGKLRITDYNGYNNGSPKYKDLQCDNIQANSVRVNTGKDFYIGVSTNELRVTNNLLYNGGNTGFKPVRASDFIKASSAEFKHDIKKWDYDALNVISNELQLYSYKYNDDEKETIHHGPVIGDGYDIPVEFVFNSGVNTNEMLSWALRAIQQLNEKINTLEEQINE